MESPVVVDKPPEFRNTENERGFPFDEEESGSAWSNLAARHPDIAARLRSRPHTWARKRRPSGQDNADDFGDEFAGFDRFPFDDIPPEFREHFPHFRRYEQQQQPQQTQQQQPQQPPPQQPQQQSPPPPPPPVPPQQQTASTQTEPAQSSPEPLPQYGLRNTVDLGQKSPVDPSVDERAHRAYSAPPDHPEMSTSPPRDNEHSNVRHIPIFVEGRDEPVINKSEHAGSSAPPPPPPDREQYFAEDAPAGFHHPPNFPRAFGTRFNKGFRQGPQPFTQQKAYPQTAQFARGNSPQRSQSPHQAPHQAPHHPAHHPTQEHFVNVPVHHEPPRTQQRPQQPQTQAPPPQPQPQPQPPPPPQQPTANDPITLILSIQTDVLNLMTDVENFTGTKKDKKYLYLDEMLTRNLIKLDNIETDGKENIRLARKEAIRCIQKCIAVLEAKAEKGSEEAAREGAPGAENGQAEPKETKDNVEVPAPEEPPAQPETAPEQPPAQPEPAAAAPDTPADTRPQTEAQPEPQPQPQPETPKQTNPKKKVVKKRDKSKEATAAKENKQEPKTEGESMQVDEQNSQKMEVDGAAASP